MRHLAYDAVRQQTGSRLVQVLSGHDITGDLAVSLARDHCTRIPSCTSIACHRERRSVLT
jgi:hypothetical protein